MTSSAPSATPPSSLEGTLIGGKFRLERVLGEGGMGVVYAAVHLDLRKHVAIKLIRDELIQNHEVVERMLNEARIAASLRSEHVARVLDVGTLESGAPFIVMEYLEGVDLATMLSEEGPLAPQMAVDYILQACEAVAEAHAAGIVHRDIKPDNIFISSGADGEPMAKVLDFGVSKVLVTERDAGALTNPSSLIGSPSYMAPESMQNSEQAGPPADVWSLGAVLYELVSGVRPFDGKNLPETCAKVLATEPTPLRSLAPAVPQALEDIVHQCLAKDARKRLTVLALAAALAPLGSADSSAVVRRIERVSSGIRLKPRSMAPGARIVTPASSLTPTDSTPPLAHARESREPAAPHTRKLQVRVVGGLALGACLVLAGLAVTLTRSSEASALAKAQPGIAARTETVIAATAPAVSAESEAEAETKKAEQAKADDAKRETESKRDADAKSAKKPEPAKADAKKPEAKKPEPAKPEPAKPEPAKPAAGAKPGAPKPAGAAAKHPAAPPSGATGPSTPSTPSGDVYPTGDPAPPADAAPAAPPEPAPPAPDAAPGPAAPPSPPAATPPPPAAPESVPPAE
jgi:serine/threonine protein kinase